MHFPERFCSILLKHLLIGAKSNSCCDQSRTGLYLQSTFQQATHGQSKPQLILIHARVLCKIWALVASHALKLLNKQQVKSDVDSSSILHAMYMFPVIILPQCAVLLTAKALILQPM